MKLSTLTPPKVVLAGSVSSSRRTLQALLRHGVQVVGILGLSPRKSTNVSGYCRLDDLAQSADVPFYEFEKINHPDVLRMVQKWSPDFLFVIGLSQLVDRELLSIPKVGSVGFHPTWLPKGRGRAPVAWLTLEGCPGAATFFLMDEGTDSGPILVQEPFFVSEQDYAGDVIEKIESAIDSALERWLPYLIIGECNSKVQESEQATYYGRRSPEDGLIQWTWSAHKIHSLVRASSRPHPGAYTYVGQYKLIIWRAEIDLHTSYRGEIGRILTQDATQGWLVQTGNGLLRLTEIEFPAASQGEVSRLLRVGTKLGYAAQDEIFQINHQLVRLEQRIAILEQKQIDKAARSNI